MEKKKTTKLVINIYNQDEAFRASKKLKAEFWNSTSFLNLENFHSEKILKKVQISRAVTLCEMIWTVAFFFVSHIKSCSGIIDSLVLPWPLVAESFYYRIKNEDSKFQSKGLQLWVKMHFLAFLIISFSQGKKWTSKLMSYQMHNYSKELYKYICAYLDGCVSELWLLHSQPAAL